MFHLSQQLRDATTDAEHKQSEIIAQKAVIAEHEANLAAVRQAHEKLTVRCRQLDQVRYCHKFVRILCDIAQALTKSQGSSELSQAKLQQMEKALAAAHGEIHALSDRHDDLTTAGTRSYLRCIESARL